MIKALQLRYINLEFPLKMFSINFGKHDNPVDQDINWTSYVRSIYVLCLRGTPN